jgi:hypothetical protein
MVIISFFFKNFIFFLFFFAIKGKKKGKEMTKYIIITFGPTGSGKTSLITKTMNALGLSGHPYTKILVDDLVENNDYYKSKVREIIQDVKERCQGEKATCMKETFEHPPQYLLDEFKTAYFTTRKTKKCGDMTCDEKNDELYKNAVNREKQDVVIMEQTGTYIPAWMFTREWIPREYTLICSYSLVNYRELRNRNISRAYKSILEFDNDPSKPAPRLPDIRHDSFYSNVSGIRNVLLHLYNSCILHNTESFDCGQIPIDRLFLFDNNGSSSTPLFDSSIDKLSSLEFEDAVNEQFNLPSVKPTSTVRIGGTRKNKNKK